MPRFPSFCVVLPSLLRSGEDACGCGHDVSSRVVSCRLVLQSTRSRTVVCVNVDTGAVAADDVCLVDGAKPAMTSPCFTTACGLEVPLLPPCPL